jgi:hypothetical protein
MPRGQSSGPRNGTFACRTFHRKTKASKRANFCHVQNLSRRNNTMDNKNLENIKNNQVLKHYGIAMFHAQLLETQAVNMIVLARHLDAKNGKKKKTLNELFEDYEYGKRTFGVLINELKSFYQLDEQDKVGLEQLLDWRNYLAHDYFKFNIMLLSTDMGRKRMIQDFESFVDKVETLDDRLETYVQDFYLKQGITTEELDTIVNNTTEELKKKIIGPEWITKFK